MAKPVGDCSLPVNDQPAEPILLWSELVLNKIRLVEWMPDRESEKYQLAVNGFASDCFRRKL